MVHYTKTLSLLLLFSLPIIGMHKNAKKIDAAALLAKRQELMNLREENDKALNIEHEAIKPITALNWEKKEKMTWDSENTETPSEPFSAIADLTQTVAIKTSYKTEQEKLLELQAQKNKLEEKEQLQLQKKEEEAKKLAQRLLAKQAAIDGATNYIAQIIKEKEKLNALETTERTRLEQMQVEATEIENVLNPESKVPTKEETKKKGWFGW